MEALRKVFEIGSLIVGCTQRSPMLFLPGLIIVYFYSPIGEFAVAFAYWNG